MELTQLKSSDILPLKRKLYEEQNNKCPILDCEFPLEEMVIDHVHKRKRSDEPGVEKGGLVRGAINRYANIILGKIENSWRRTGLESQGYDLPEVLRKMADYLEQDILPYIHPTEKIPEKRFKKTCYNKLVKEMKAAGFKGNIPPYPTRKKKDGKIVETGKLTKGFEKLFEKYKINVEYY